MTTLLAIDTSSSICSIALTSANETLYRSSAEPRRAAQELLPNISALLNECAIGLAQVDAIAVAIGPGSFTGIRIGVGAVQGLSASLSIPVIPLSSLAVAAMSNSSQSIGSCTLVSQVARDSEVYFGAYLASETLGVELLGQEQVCAPEEVVVTEDRNAEIKNYHAVGDGWIYQQQLEAALGLDLGKIKAENSISMEAFCQLARCRFDSGDTTTAELLRPNYIKEHMVYSK